VCFTPPQTPATPPGVPIPYPNTGMASDTTDGSSTVTINGEQAMLKNQSSFKQSTGDEAGAAPKKGMINSKTKGKVFFVAWSMDVKFEGENVVRNLDLTTHNHGSTPNAPKPQPFVAKTAAGQAGSKNDPCRHPNNRKKRIYVVYMAMVIKGKGKGKVYIGRTQGKPGQTIEAILKKRKSGHHREDIGDLQEVCTTDSYAAVRGAEQKHKEDWAAQGLGADQINCVGPRNKVKKKKYEDCAKQKNAAKCGVCGA
jgi:uncharacterized Zn-binding protein involved in type VI secretion